MKKIKGFFKGFKWYNYIIYFLFIGLFLLSGLLSYWVWLLMFVVFVFWCLFMVFHSFRFLKYSSGNGIIYGGRGKGKGVLLNKKANSLKKVFSNVPYGNSEYLTLKEYSDSIGDNTILDTINGTIKAVKKIDKFEKVNVLFDDISLYAPNFLDSVLKSKFPQLPLVLAVNRHLYDHYMIATVQDRERPWKIIKELQTDFSIKALKTIGWGWFWRSIPIFRHFVIVKYRYYEEVKSAIEGVLPFKGAGLINEGVKGAYLTGGQATKETFKAMYGVVFHGYVCQFKKNIRYDTRYFHELFYGYKAF